MWEYGHPVQRGSPETLPYRLAASLLFGVGLLTFAIPLAYGGGWWYALSALGAIVMFSGLGVVLYSVRRYGPNA
jgi:uncharacterized membrane protein